MPTEVRVLGGTALFTAALVCIAWWLGQHHDDIAQRLHPDETVTAEPYAFSVGDNTPRALPVMPTDAGLMSAPDAAADEMSGAEAELAAILIPAICNRRRNECQCEEYPSRFAPEEERVGATTCEQDTLRDFRSWWRNNIDGPVVVVRERELSEALAAFASCDGGPQPAEFFVRADAVAGEACTSSNRCRDGSPCEAGLCVRFQQSGEPCRTNYDHRRLLPKHDCAYGLTCTDGRCEAELLEEEDEDHHYMEECPGGFVALASDSSEESNWYGPNECLPMGTECWDHDECGSGACVGVGPMERRCVVSTQPSGYDPGDHDAMRCRSQTCERGTVCMRGLGECFPVVALGERCERAVCGAGLECERVHRARGHCIQRACLTSHPFRELRMSGTE